MERGSFVVVTLTLEPDTLVYGTEYNVQLTSAKGNTIITDFSTFDSASSAEYDPLKDEALQSELQSIASRQEPGTSRTMFVVVTSIAVIVEVSACLLIYYRNRPISSEELAALVFLTIVFVIATIMVTVSVFLSPLMAVG
jgi:hypothetical protein